MTHQFITKVVIACNKLTNILISKLVIHVSAVHIWQNIVWIFFQKFRENAIFNPIMPLHEEFLELITKLKSQEEKLKSSTWEQIMTFRLEANELLSERQNQKLSQYEEKIFMKNLFDKFSIPTTKVMTLWVVEFQARGFKI